VKRIRFELYQTLGFRRFLEAATSLSDIGLAAILEFLKIIDCKLPQWALDYLAAIER